MQLNRLLAHFHVAGCAFITAWNPRSTSTPIEQNHVRQTALTEHVRRCGYISFSGEGMGPDGKWPPEASLLIVGISRKEAQDLGARFGQLAVVYVEPGRRVELLLCPAPHEDSCY